MARFKCFRLKFFIILFALQNTSELWSNSLIQLCTAPAEGTPVIISANWSSNYTSSVGGCLQLYCPATSSAHNSPLNFIWMRKGGRVPMSGTRIRQNGNGTLLFDEVRPEDKGHYWCVVWNSGGVSMEMTSLIITNSSTEEPHPPTAVDSAPLHHHCLSLIATLSLVNTILS